MAEVIHSRSLLHFETGIARSERHEDCDFEDGIVLPVPGVVALQEAPAHRGSRAGKLGEVQVNEAQLLIRPSAFDFLQKETRDDQVRRQCADADG